MLIIGLTGGIGSGKSTVAGYFAQHGVPILDADQIARELVVPGSAALQDIIAAFGPEVLQEDGALNRPYLRQQIFSDPTKRRQLEGMLHSRIYAEIHRRIQTLHAPYCVLVIPLLLETRKTGLVDRVLVVDAPESLQRERARTRDQLDAATIEAILHAQISRAERLRAANDIIVNDADLNHLHDQVGILHQRYLTLSARPPPRSGA